MDLTGKGVLEVLSEFERFWIGQEIEGDQYKPAERGLFRQIVQGVLDHQVELDRAADRILRPAGRCNGSRRCCAPCCAPALSS